MHCFCCDNTSCSWKITMKRKFNQSWPMFPPISIKTNNYLSLQIIDTKERP